MDGNMVAKTDEEKKVDREKKEAAALALVPDKEKMRLLTTRELSRLTGLARWRIFALVAEADRKPEDAGKAPPHFRVGRTLRFPQSGVVEWILREQTTNQKESA